VDAAWHELILEGSEYEKHCHVLMGGDELLSFIHHNPDGAQDDDRESRYRSTWEIYVELFQSLPPEIAWEV
jgi:hypothetical protein